MTRNATKLAATFCCVFLAGCPGGTVRLDGVEAVLGAGWQCLLVPSSFDAPGSIFSVQAGGQKLRLADLSDQVKVHDGTAAMGRITENRTLGGNIVLGLLENAIPGVSARLSGTAKTERRSVVQYGDLTYQVTYQDAADQAEKWFRGNVKPQAGARYFLVREAYVAGKISYDLTAEEVSALGGEAEFKKLISAKGELARREAGNAYKLDQSFSPKLRTCILPYEFIPSAGLGGERTWSLGTQPASVPAIRPDPLAR
jgi:hypothetical protein